MSQLTSGLVSSLHNCSTPSSCTRVWNLQWCKVCGEIDSISTNVHDIAVQEQPREANRWLWWGKKDLSVLINVLTILSNTTYSQLWPWFRDTSQQASQQTPWWRALLRTSWATIPPSRQNQGTARSPMPMSEKKSFKNNTIRNGVISTTYIHIIMYMIWYSILYYSRSIGQSDSPTGRAASWTERHTAIFKMEAQLWRAMTRRLRNTSAENHALKSLIVLTSPKNEADRAINKNEL